MIETPIVSLVLFCIMMLTEIVYATKLYLEDKKQESSYAYILAKKYTGIDFDWNSAPPVYAAIVIGLVLLAIPILNIITAVIIVYIITIVKLKKRRKNKRD